MPELTLLHNKETLLIKKKLIPLFSPRCAIFGELEFDDNLYLIFGKKK